MSTAGEKLREALVDLRIEVKFPELELSGIKGPFYAIPLKLKEVDSYRPSIRGEDSRVWGKIIREHLVYENGDHVFDNMDTLYFDEGYPQQMVERVAIQIYDGSTTSFEDALKNSKAIPTSTDVSRSLTSAA